ncbi:MAG: YdbH domain-containing protein [Verrucomicrobiales bacterium]|nr:YdbH domain-containing protein [Verrucomicrobiales bacterium]
MRKAGHGGAWAVGRGVGKFVVWLLAMLMAVSLLVAGALWVVYKNPAQVANLVLEDLLIGQQVEVDRVLLSEPGLLRIEGLRIAGVNDEDSWLDLGEVEIEYDWQELKEHRHVKALRLKYPKIRIDDGVLEALGMGGLKTGEEKPAAGKRDALDLSFLALLSDEIQVEGGELQMALPGMPPMRFSFDVDFKGLSSEGVKEQGWISGEPLHLSLRDVEMKTEKGAVMVKGVDLLALVSRDARVIDIKSLRITRPQVEITPQILKAFASDRVEGAAVEKSKAVSEKDEAEQVAELKLTMAVLEIESGHFELRGFDGGDGELLLPDVSFDMSLKWNDISVLGSEIRSREDLAVKVTDLLVDAALKSEGASTLLKTDALEVSFLPQAVQKRWRLELLSIKGPEIHLSSRNMARLSQLSSRDKKVGVKPVEEGDSKNGAAASGPGFELGRLKVSEGMVFLGDMGKSWLPEGETGFALDLQDLKMDGKSVLSSSADQRVKLIAVKVRGASEGRELFAAKGVDLGFKLDDLLGYGLVDKLWIESPKVVVDDEALGRWLPQAKDGDAASGKLALGSSDEQGEVVKKIWKVKDLRVRQGSLLSEVKQAIKGLPWVSGDFEVSTLPFEFSADKKQMQEPRYRVKLSSLRIRPLQKSADKKGDVNNKVGGESEKESGLRKEIGVRDVAFVKDLIVELTPTGSQKHHHIESVVVAGGTVKLGDDFQALLGSEDQATETSEKVDGEDEAQAAEKTDGDQGKVSASWSIGELGVNNLMVRLESMVPQLQGVQFSVETSMKDVPLSAQGLLSKHRVQKVEIAGIELRDPYDGMRSAAVLPTIFLKFSLAGLMRQEVEAIDILGPVIYIGEPLFNWVEYQRKYREQNEGNSLQPDEWAEDGGAAKGEKGKAKGKAGSWTLKKINAHYGKLVIAPIGTPIGIVPFPFEVETDFEDGRIALNLEIPQEQYVYSLADLKLDLYGLSGNVEFNVPIKQKANNLVQTFKLDRLVWKQFNAEKIFVSVTYDANGIYGKLGGSAYEGYVNGEFNIYLKDLGKWDGWLAATKVNMAPISRAIAPENFVMDGKVTGKLVSSGKGLELGVTTGELRGVSPGRIEITKLESVLQALPEEWTQLKRSLTEMALNGLKTFDYQQAEGTINLLNRDGEVSLDLRGASGSRLFRFYLHDWRKKEKEQADSEVVAAP